MGSGESGSGIAETDAFAMVRSVRNKRDADAPLVGVPSVELEEGERPETWSILLFGVGGFAVSYWILRSWVRGWLRLLSRRRPKAYVPAAGESAAAALLRIEPGPANTGQLAPGQTLNVPDGRWVTVFLYGRAYDGFPPGDYVLNPVSMPKLAEAIHEDDWHEHATNAVLVSAPFGPLEYRWKGTWQRAATGREGMESATVEGLADFDVKDGQAFTYFLVYCLAQRLQKEEKVSALLPKRWGGDPPFERALEHLLRGGTEQFGEVIAEYVAYSSDPDDEHGATAATSHGIAMRAKASLEKNLSAHGVEVKDLTFVEPTAFQIQPCLGCGSTEKKVLSVHLAWVAGILFDTWEVERSGNYCRACGFRQAITYTLLTPITCVWGLWSLILGAIAVYSNVLSVFGLMIGRPPLRSNRRR